MWKEEKRLRELREQFLNPSSDFTPIPFWFWNDALSHQEIKRQIHAFHEKGVDGFVLHPRMGLPKEPGYLTPEFMAYVHTAVSEASRLKMKVILYDEAMYPSGSANGRVVKEHPAYASRGLEMVELQTDAQGKVRIPLEKGERLVSAQVVEFNSNGTPLLETVKRVTPDAQLNIHFQMTDQQRVLVFIEKPSKGTIRGVHAGEDDGEEDAPASADLLNPRAVESFIKHTHEIYKQHVGKWMGTTIIAIFTDEPDILGRNASPSLRPWTENFLNDFLDHGGKEEELAALWLNEGNQIKRIHAIYDAAIFNRMSNVYYQRLSKWCEDHQLALTGHPAASTDIGLLQHFHIPGQDVVWRWVGPEDNKAIEGEHSTAAKCGADAARHRGRRRNINEFLGVCSKLSDWSLTADDMKWYIDWLSVRGVNLFCPHAFYYSIRDKERSHERPPDVGMHNSWWPYYNQFSLYMKRLSWLMTDAVNQPNVAILCTQNELPWTSAKALYQSQIEFNYLEENLLELGDMRNGELSLQKQSYRFIIVEEDLPFKPTTQQTLNKFVSRGGTILRSLEEVQTLFNQKMINLQPTHNDIRVTHIKKEDRSFFLLVNEGDDNYKGFVSIDDTNIREIWYPWTGVIEEPIKRLDTGGIAIELERRESLILVEGSPNYSTFQEQRTFGNRFSKPLVDWEITYSGEVKALTQLQFWTDWDESWRFYSGTVTYQTTVSLTEEECLQLQSLDAGEIYELAELWINDTFIATKLWAPYRFSLPLGVLKAGENHIVIHVTNSKANQMDQVSQASGLMGPVCLNN